MAKYRVHDRDSGDRLEVTTPGEPASNMGDTMARVFGELFGKIPEMVEEKGGRRLRLRGEVSDGPVWTADDVAIFINKTRDQVIRMLGSRARFQAKRDGRVPIPFKKIDSKTVLFDKDEIIKWWNKSEETVLAPTKGKRR